MARASSREVGTCIDLNRAEDGHLKLGWIWSGYGYQIWLVPGSNRMFALRGLRGQFVILIRKQNSCSCKRRSTMERPDCGPRVTGPGGRRCHPSCDRHDLNFTKAPVHLRNLIAPARNRSLAPFPFETTRDGRSTPKADERGNGEIDSQRADPGARIAWGRPPSCHRNLK